MASLTSLVVVLVALAGSAWAGPVDGVVPPGEERDEKGLAARPTDPAPLIAQLGHASWQVREQAMRGLIAVGGAARDALRKAARSTDAEVRWRAGYALSRLEGGRAEPEPDKARLLYKAAAEARQQRGNEGAARLLYQAVIRRHPHTPWAGAARERLAHLGPEAEAEGKAQDPDRLVEQLGSPNWAERQRASWRLAGLGAAAKAALERAASGPDPEVAWRARRLSERIELAEQGAKSRAAARSQSARLGMLARLFGDEVPPNRPTDLDGLVLALASSEAGEVAHARELLLNLGTDSVPPLMRGLEGAGEVAGVEIMDLLRQITGQELGFNAKRWLAWWRQLRKRGED